ncbi:hypothetical protein NECAME_06334 [Necator americanus]|uniref:Uncharacterized protein n=1 Tax=Necator americanus TaxID=51031 RepID=W2TX37_NECAM|nr:hypothetical protein NECAME_06334 [Necator americanus]ETN85631.1 hypothetical protein NECAME_06334 [Necator americanus]
MPARTSAIHKLRPDADDVGESGMDPKLTVVERDVLRIAVISTRNPERIELLVVYPGKRCSFEYLCPHVDEPITGLGELRIFQASPSRDLQCKDGKVALVHQKKELMTGDPRKTAKSLTLTCDCKF